MKKILKNLEQKSVEEKRVFALWTASLLTFFIFSIWLFNLIYLSNDIKTAGQNVEQIKNEASSISSVFNDLKNLVDNGNE